VVVVLEEVFRGAVAPRVDGKSVALSMRDRAYATVRYELGQQRKPDPRYEGHAQKIYIFFFRS
jgi:hypothetical protein